MIALLLALLASPGAAAQPPAGAAYPYYLGFIVCSEVSCDERFRAIYVEDVTDCTDKAAALPQLVIEGEEVVEWWCE